jgi:hypothetical protein
VPGVHDFAAHLKKTWMAASSSAKTRFAVCPAATSNGSPGFISQGKTMNNKTSLQLALAAATLAFTIPASRAEDAALPAAVTEHIAAATAAAKMDEFGPLGLCKTATPRQGPSFMDNYKVLLKEPPLSRSR